MFKNITRNHLIDFGVYSTLALTCVLISFQSPLAPLGFGYPSVDSQAFMYIAKAMMHGTTIYSDVFDNKGFLLYFINIAGLKIGGGNPLGIWFLELMSLIITGIFLYKSVHLSHGKFTSWLSTLVSLLFIVDVFFTGNIPEEWALPFISIALYIFCLYFDRGRVFSVFQLFVLSFTFTCAFMIKINAVAVWGAIALTITFDNACRKRYKILSRYYALVILFVAASLLPYIIYAWHASIIHDAWYAIFEFPILKYPSNCGFDNSLKSIAGRAISQFTGRMALPFCCTIYVLYSSYEYFMQKKHEKHIGLNTGISLAIVLTVVSCSMGRISEHFFIQYVPILVFAYALVIDFILKHLQNKKVHILVASALLAANITVILKILQRPAVMFSRHATPSLPYPDSSSVIAIINKYTKPDETILVPGFSVWMYLETKRHCSSKYPFIYPIINADNKIAEEYFHQLTTQPPRLLIKDSWVNDLHADIRNKLQVIIEEKFIKLDTNLANYEFWLLKDEFLYQMKRI